MGISNSADGGDVTADADEAQTNGIDGSVTAGTGATIGGRIELQGGYSAAATDGAISLTSGASSGGRSGRVQLVAADASSGNTSVH